MELARTRVFRARTVVVLRLYDTEASISGGNAATKRVRFFI